MRTPMIVMTVYRRYHELDENLREVRYLAEEEWGISPTVVVVWARPEVGRLALFHAWQNEGLIQHVISRHALPGERGDGPTTYPESHNIRLGLEYAKSQLPPDGYVLLMAADVCPQPGALSYVQTQMEAGNEAAVFHWENTMCGQDIWHTNFFAVSMNEVYWPPLSPITEDDVLERQWGKRLVGMPNIHRWHNSGNRKFVHDHKSERLAAMPYFPLPASEGFSLNMRGRRKYPWEWLISVWKSRRFKWLK